MATYQAKFSCGDHVVIDGDSGLRGTVVAVQFRATYACPVYGVAWIANGVHQEPFIEEYRLSAWSVG